MPRPAHGRLTFSGVFGSLSAPLERWSVNLSMSAVATVLDPTAAKAAAAAARAAWDANIRTTLPGSVSLTRTRYASIGQDGVHVVTSGSGVYQQGDDETVSTGTGTGGTAMPLQTALVISLRSTRGGPTGKGRIFLPFPAQALDASTRAISGGGQTFLATQFQSFFNALNASTAIPGELIVASTKGYVSAVNAVAVGAVPDTMRSRRANLPEGYVALPVTPGPA